MFNKTISFGFPRSQPSWRGFSARSVGVQIPRDSLNRGQDNNTGFQISIFFFFLTSVPFSSFRWTLHFKDEIPKFPVSLIMGIKKPFNCTNSLYIMVHNHEVGLTFCFSLANYIMFLLCGEWGRGDLTCDRAFLSLSPSLSPSQSQCFIQSFKSPRQKTPPFLITLNAWTPQSYFWHTVLREPKPISTVKASDAK